MSPAKAHGDITSPEIRQGAAVVAIRDLRELLLPSAAANGAVGEPQVFLGPHLAGGNLEKHVVCRRLPRRVGAKDSRKKHVTQVSVRDVCNETSKAGGAGGVEASKYNDYRLEHASFAGSQ